MFKKVCSQKILLVALFGPYLIYTKPSIQRVRMQISKRPWSRFVFLVQTHSRPNLVKESNGLPDLLEVILGRLLGQSGPMLKGMLAPRVHTNTSTVLKQRGSQGKEDQEAKAKTC